MIWDQREREGYERLREMRERRKGEGKGYIKRKGQEVL